MRLGLLQSIILASMLGEGRFAPEQRSRKSLPHLELEQGPMQRPKFALDLSVAAPPGPMKRKRKLSRAERKREKAKERPFKP